MFGVVLAGVVRGPSRETPNFFSRIVSACSDATATTSY